MRHSKAFGLALVAIFIAAPSFAQHLVPSGPRKNIERDGSTSGTLQDVWVEMKTTVSKISLEPDADGAGGAARADILHCTQFNTPASCVAVNVFDTNADGVADSNAMTGTDPQRVAVVSWPGYALVDITTQPLGVERPVITIEAAQGGDVTASSTANTDGEIACFEGTTGRRLRGCGGVTISALGLITVPNTGGILVEQGSTGQYIDLYEGSGGGTDKTRFVVSNTLATGGHECKQWPLGGWSGVGCPGSKLGRGGQTARYFAQDLDAATWSVYAACPPPYISAGSVTGMPCSDPDISLAFEATTTATMTEFRCRHTDSQVYTAGSISVEIWEFALGEDTATGGAKIGLTNGAIVFPWTTPQNVWVQNTSLPLTAGNSRGYFLLYFGTAVAMVPATPYPDLECEVTIEVD
jgi:hypothetical protein